MTGTLFDDQLRVRANDPDTSVAAAESIRPVLGKECALVLGAVTGNAMLGRGATAYEIVVALRMAGLERDQSVIARRLTDLREAGLIVDTGDRRPGRSGRLLIVWAVA